MYVKITDKHILLRLSTKLDKKNFFQFQWITEIIVNPIIEPSENVLAAPLANLTNITPLKEGVLGWTVYTHKHTDIDSLPVHHIIAL